MPKKYVFDVVADGTSDITIEQDITTIPPIVAGLMAMDLWSNTETPADLNRPGDPTQGAGFLHEPPDGGAIVRILDFQPEASRPAVDTRTLHKEIGSVHIPSAEYLSKAKHPSMHKTDTLNYFVLLTGRLWALSEGKDVLLEPGDVLIQKGAMHGWRNDGSAPARLFAVLIDATWEKRGT
jgi:mannose-6-phosphate isomerase-like protein (cupin superfamily)